MDPEPEFDLKFLWYGPFRDPETYLDRRGFLFPTDVVNSVMEEILSAGNVLKPSEEEKIIQNYDETKILPQRRLLAVPLGQRGRT